MIYMCINSHPQDWLYDEGDDATKAAYVSKMEEIRFIAGPIVGRHLDKLEEERQAAQAAREAEMAKKRAQQEALKEEMAKQRGGKKPDAKKEEAKTEAPKAEDTEMKDADAAADQPEAEVEEMD